jgi:hypothetical protein
MRSFAMSSVLKGGDGGDRLIMPEFCHLTGDSEGRRTDGMPSLCCAVVHSPDDAFGLNVGAHAVGHRRNAKGSGCGACALGEFCHHLVHLIGVDRWIIPGNAVLGRAYHPSDLPVGHAAHELLPWGLTLSELHTCLSSVVEELVVADPEGSVPGFVVSPTVHESCAFVLLKSSRNPVRSGVAVCQLFS